LTRLTSRSSGSCEGTYRKHGNGKFTVLVGGGRLSLRPSFLKAWQWRPKKGKGPSRTCWRKRNTRP